MAAKTHKQKSDDTMLKVIALVCAVLLWFYAESQENPSIERQLTVPVQYVNVASGYVVEDTGQSVQVLIKGKETDIVSLRSDDFTATVDMSEAQVGSGSYAVRVAGDNVAERFTYTPNQVTVSVDQIQQKEVSVRVRTDGTVAQAYELKNTDVQPDVVTIRGKSKQLADITDVETQVIDLSGITKDTVQQVSLNLPKGVTAKVGDGSFVSDAEVEVGFHVQQKQKTMTLTPSVALRNVSEGHIAVVEPEAVTMTLQGSLEYMNGQPFMDVISLYVDCSGLEAGGHTLPVQVEYADAEVRTVVKSMEPQSVTVTVTMQGEPAPGIDDAGNNSIDTEINDEKK